MSLRLSKNFSEREFTRSRTARRLNIDNSFKSQQHRDNAIMFCENFLEPIRKVLNKPIFITSGYRCQELNKVVGGVSNSAHIQGLAADFVVPEMSVPQIFDLICQARKEKLIPTWDQLLCEYGEWIHIGSRTQVAWNRGEEKKLFC